MSKSGFASEKVMKNYLGALLTDVDEQQPEEPTQQPTRQPAQHPLRAESQTVEDELRPVAKLLQKVSVVEREQVKVQPQEAKAPAAPIIEVKKDAKELPNANPSVQTQSQRAVKPAEQKQQVEKKYRKGQFQALFFDVAGLTLAVPLTELGGIHNMGKLNVLVGKPDWFMGVMVYRDSKLSIVNTAKWVMPEKYDNSLENDLEYQYIIMLDNSPWGLACEKLINTVTLEHDDVKWRETSGRRPWLAGLIKERMCALIDVSALIEMLEQGLGSQDKQI
ncbi:MAG: purine-binding chemotaxis protein CheW [Alteromonadaceae bacterium]